MTDRDHDRRSWRTRLRTVLTVARAEYRSEDHRVTKTRRKQAILALAIAASLPFLAAMLFGAFVGGRIVGAGDAPGLLQLARWYLPGAVLLTALFGAIEAHKFVLDFEAKPLLLTTVPDRELALGLLLQGTILHVAVYVAGVVLAFGAFAYGAGAPIVAIVGGSAAVLLLLAGSAVGILVGLAARLVARRSGWTSGSNAVYGTLGQLLGVAVGAGVGAGVVLVGIDLAEGGSLSALTPAGPPPLAIGFYADLFFVGTPLVDGVGVASLLGVLLFLGAVPVGVAGIVRLAPRLWRLDPATPQGRPTEVEKGEETVTEDAPAPTQSERSRSYLDLELPLVDRQFVVVALGLLRRALRRPQRYAYVAYYAMTLGMLIGAVAANPENLPMYVGATLLLVGLWFAGGVFALNPLGEEGAMLGQLVLSETPGRTILRARAAVGTLFGLPFVLVGTGLLAVDLLDTVDAVVLGTYWLGLLPVSGTVALGIGTLLPASETRRVLDAVEVRAPDLFAIGLHAIVVAILAVVGPLLWFADLPGLPTAVGVLALAASLLVLTDGSWRFAVGGLAGYGRPPARDPIFAVELGLGLCLFGTVLSITVPQGIAGVVPVEGSAGFLLRFVAAFVGWGLLAGGYLVATGRRDYLDLTLPSASDLRVVAVGTTASLAILGGLVAGQTLFGLPAVENSLLGEQVDAAPWLLVALAVLALTVNGPVEEVFFRNVVQKRLAEDLSTGAAIAVAAVLFALVHVPSYATTDPVELVAPLTALALVGGVWGLVYERTETVVAPALSHGVYNAAIFLSLFATAA